ncbi:MAG TPA: cupredoxin domain-containing protein [Thermomicrobiales bacterium]|nr:cupredoxin domain-containing protein [Thermomicrobiales bacterium]
MHIRRFTAATFVAVMIAVVAVAGSIRVGAGALPSGRASCASPVASPAATPPASPVSSPIASPIPECVTPAAITSVTIEAHDLYFAPNAITLAANTDVTLTIKNAGALPHDFYVDGLNIRTAIIPPGNSVTVTLNASPGTYQFYCNQPGHRFAGMTGTLVVK